MSYLHGTIGKLGETKAQNAVQSATIPCYVGLAPINLIRGYAQAGIINKPIKLTNWAQAQRTLGYSNNWEAFSLGEVQKLHFNNTMGNVGPIYVINVLNPETHAKSANTTKQLTFANKRAEFLSDTIILDTFAIADKAEGVDYELSYDFNKGMVIVTLLTEATGGLSATFKEVDTSAVSATDIVGGINSDGEYSGISAIALIYKEEFQTVTLLAAPGWSHEPTVYNALVAMAKGINGKWLATAHTDIPLGTSTDTITKAIAWKKANGYQDEFSKVYWPMGADSEGKLYHGSALAVWKFQSLDAETKGVPGNTCSNKPVPVLKQYFGANAKNQGFDDQDGNELNANGITTLVPFNGQWVLWGGHTAAYQYGVTTDARQIFDTAIRMLHHCANSFQKEWAPRIDKPMTLNLRDEILNRENDRLKSFVSLGYLIGEPQCVFVAEENPTSDLMNGDFTWDMNVTPTPQFKSGTVTVSYTDEGFSVYNQ